MPACPEPDPSWSYRRRRTRSHRKSPTPNPSSARVPCSTFREALLESYSSLLPLRNVSSELGEAAVPAVLVLPALFGVRELLVGEDQLGLAASVVEFQGDDRIFEAARHVADFPLPRVDELLRRPDLPVLSDHDVGGAALGHFQAVPSPGPQLQQRDFRHELRVRRAPAP